MKLFIPVFVMGLFPVFSAPAQTKIFKQTEKEFTYSNESEVSLLNSGGNSEFETYNAETRNIFLWDKNQVRIEGHYTYGESNEVLSARNWHGEARYDRQLSKRFSAFFSEKVEGDNLAGLKTRYNSDLGSAYLLHQGEKNTTLMEIAYRYSIEQSTDPTIEEDNLHKGKLYFETRTQHNEDVSTKFWAEYIPNFTEGSDYILTFEPSLKVALNSLFSLKLAYKGSYDNLPSVPGRKKYDYLYTTALLAKF